LAVAIYLPLKNCKCKLINKTQMSRQLTLVPHSALSEFKKVKSKRRRPSALSKNDLVALARKRGKAQTSSALRGKTVPKLLAEIGDVTESVCEQLMIFVPL
jgi:hypothetical protein